VRGRLEQVTVPARAGVRRRRASKQRRGLAHGVRLLGLIILVTTLCYNELPKESNSGVEYVYRE
jgi:hypothetical protein